MLKAFFFHSAFISPRHFDFASPSDYAQFSRTLRNHLRIWISCEILRARYHVGKGPLNCQSLYGKEDEQLKNVTITYENAIFIAKPTQGKLGISMYIEKTKKRFPWVVISFGREAPCLVSQVNFSSWPISPLLLWMQVFLSCCSKKCRKRVIRNSDINFFQFNNTIAFRVIDYPDGRFSDYQRLKFTIRLFVSEVKFIKKLVILQIQVCR